MEAGGEKEHDIFLEVDVGWNDWSGRAKKVIVRDQGQRNWPRPECRVWENSECFLQEFECCYKMFSKCVCVCVCVRERERERERE